MILVKFWLHLSDEEQLRRFERRQHDPLKQWKLTDEDWRNREKRRPYEAAVEEMIERTDRPYAPWTLVEAESKRWARVGGRDRHRRSRTACASAACPSPRPRPELLAQIHS